VIGSILGFLRFNTYPARLFMGDGGSQFLGFILGALVIIVTQQTHRALSPAVVLLILGLPVLDTLMVMVQRIKEGRSPFVADKNHIHHKLLRIGFDHYEAVGMIYMIQALMVTSAYLLRYQMDLLLMGLYLGLSVVIITVFYFAEKNDWHVRQSESADLSFIAKRVQWLKKTGFLTFGPYHFLRVSIPLFLIVGAFFPGEIPIDISILSLVLMSAMIVAILVRSMPFYMLERATIYCAGAFVVYLVHETSGDSYNVDLFITAFFVILALMLVVGVRFTLGGTFKTTPLDYLIIFIAIVAPNLSTLGFTVRDYAAVALQLIVLYYASEFVITRVDRSWDLLRYGTIGSLLVLGIRGIM
jgi:UDP-GlcNAc:undecaprenyl-phosphate GlcNAc-1-phosphate transferase